MAQKQALIIFTRNPELGIGKRRLAATIGDEATLAIYRFLLEHTRQITRHLAVTKQVWYSQHVQVDDAWDNTIYEKYAQSGADLGQRMHHAFNTAFKNHDRVIIVGSDIYDLTQEAIEDAFKQLDNHDAVIGPAIDGGYYLLGFKNSVPDGVFSNKNWGSDTVLEATLADLKNVATAILTPRNDVDHYDDIKDVTIFQPFLKDYHAH